MKSYIFKFSDGEIKVNQTKYAYKTKIWGGDHYSFRFNIEFNGVVSDNFTFHGSEFDFNKGKKEFSEEVAKDALGSVILDCLSAIDYPDYESFSEEFGESKKVFNAVNSEFKKINKLFTVEQIEKINEEYEF